LDQILDGRDLAVARQHDGATGSPVAWGQSRAISDDVVDDGRPVLGGSSEAASPAGAWVDGSGVEAGFLSAAVGLAVEDEFVGGGLATRLWQEDETTMRTAVARHDQLLRGVVAGHGGWCSPP
jgi:hypothetical protein